MALNKKYQLFVDTYMSNKYNATQAYLAINPDVGITTANSGGLRLLKNPEVKAEIDRRYKEYYSSLRIDGERIMEELAEMAFAEKGDDKYTAQVKLKALDLLQKQLGLQSQKIDATIETTIINVKVEDEDD